MKVDIAVCTWNRAESLRQTLDSFTRLAIPNGVLCRYVVVDNNSNDNTRHVVDSFKPKLNLISAIETQQGHTHARNAAVELADGELIIWTDDDVIVDSQWVTSYVEAATANPNAMFFGGRIVPVFQPKAPHWITENWNVLQGCFAARDLGNDEIDLTLKQLPYGANFAIRTSIQKQFRFDHELGRRGEQVLGEDEIELFRRLIDAGYCGKWVPNSSLEHLIPNDRATEKYVHDYFVGQGRVLKSKGQSWSSSVTRLRLSWLYERLMYAIKRRMSPSPAWVAHLIRCGLAEGQI